MVSIEQIAILEQKVESAVARIAQLTAENDALRSKCVELTNALSAKTEQLSAFQNDQNKIEVGIMKALEQLKSLEGTISVAPQEPEPQESEAEQTEEVPQETADEQAQPTEAAGEPEQEEPEPQAEASPDDGSGDAEQPSPEPEAAPEETEAQPPADAPASDSKAIFDIF